MDRSRPPDRRRTSTRASPTSNARRAEGHPPATSVFFGGGTPSLLAGRPARRASSTRSSAPTTPRSPSSAIPTASTRPSSRRTAAAGVNRLSFGVQSMAPHVLAALGRTHDPANVDARGRARARRRLRAHQRRPHLRHAGRDARRLAARRSTARSRSASSTSSAYALTVEPATPLGRRVAAGARRARRRRPGRRVRARRRRCSRAAGLEWYEVSNWARPGEECRHNLLYWSEGEYLGIGCAAHGHTDGRRWWNVRTPERYIAAIDGGRVGRGRRPRRLDADAAGRGGVRARAAHPRAVRRSPTRPPAVVDELAAPGSCAGSATGSCSRARGRLLASDVTARLLLAGARLALGNIECQRGALALGTIECQ